MKVTAGDGLALLVPGRADTAKDTIQRVRRKLDLGIKITCENINVLVSELGEENESDSRAFSLHFAEPKLRPVTKPDEVKLAPPTTMELFVVVHESTPEDVRPKTIKHVECMFQKLVGIVPAELQDVKMLKQSRPCAMVRFSCAKAQELLDSSGKTGLCFRKAVRGVFRRMMKLVKNHTPLRVYPTNPAMPIRVRGDRRVAAFAGADPRAHTHTHSHALTCTHMHSHALTCTPMHSHALTCTHMHTGIHSRAKREDNFDFFFANTCAHMYSQAFTFARSAKTIFDVFANSPHLENTRSHMQSHAVTGIHIRAKRKEKN